MWLWKYADYGNAVVCELNAQLNGCRSLLPAWHCTDIDICFNLIPPQSYLSLKPNTNPFLYCSEANCEHYMFVLLDQEWFDFTCASEWNGSRCIN